jgi:hypothetical protein
VQGTNGVPATSGYVQFDLQPSSSAILFYVQNTTTLVPQSGQCGINGSGQIKALDLTDPCLVWGNDVIIPANTLYRVTFAPNNTPTNYVSNIQINSICTNLNLPCFGPIVSLVPQSAIVITPQVQSNLIPTANNVFNLGAPSFYYASGYIRHLFGTDFTGIVIGNASTASAFDHTPTLCSTGFVAMGILANGAATGCSALAGSSLTIQTNGTPNTNQTLLNFLTSTTNALSLIITPSNSVGTEKHEITSATGLTSHRFLATCNTATTISLCAPVAADFPTLNQNTSGNAATATVLASTPSLCASGSAPIGILANGNATGCTPYDQGISNHCTATIPNQTSLTNGSGVVALTTCSVVTPSAGCPCQAEFAYTDTLLKISAGQGVVMWVSSSVADSGSNSTFALGWAGESNAATGGAAEISGNGFSLGTWGNSTALVFTLNAQISTGTYDLRQSMDGLSPLSGPAVGPSNVASFQVRLTPDNN